jgi:glutamate/aspartate transport system substrate-binding protein
MHLKQLILISSALVVSLATPLSAAAETTLAKIKRTGTITLGYRDSSMPFSFLDERKQLLGYSVDLCKQVASDVARELHIEKLDVRWLPVTAKSRFEDLKSGQIDLECGNTTHTLA